MPVHPVGVVPIIVLVCWPLEPQADHDEYVYPVHVPVVGGIQACVNTDGVEGVPVHPAGVLLRTVLVCWPLEPQADHAEYEYPVQATGAGVQACDSTAGVEGVPVHPAGVLLRTVLVCWPLEPQADHAEYEYPVQATVVGGLLVALPGFVPALISTMLVAPSPSESCASIVLKLWPALAHAAPYALRVGAEVWQIEQLNDAVAELG